MGKKGVVRESAVHREVIAKVVDYADRIGFSVLHLEYSPIRGPEGNIEYLLHLEKRENVLPETLSLTEHEAEAALRDLAATGTGLSSCAEWKQQIVEVTARAALSAK